MRTTAYKAFFCILLSMCSNYSFSLASKISLKEHETEWENESNSDSIRLANLHRLTWDYYLFKKPDSAFYFASLGYAFAEKSNQTQFKGSAANVQGIAKAIQGHHEEAISYYNKALEAFSSVGDSALILSVLGNIGTSYRNLNQYGKALEYDLLDLDYELRHNDSIGMANSYNNLGIIYNEIGRIKEAILAKMNALKIYEGLKDSAGIARAYINLGLFYYQQAEYDKAEEIYLKALAFNEMINSPIREASIFGNLGNNHFKQNELDRALKYFVKGYKLAKENDIINTAANNLHSIGNVYYQWNMLDSANHYFLLSMESYIAIKDQVKQALVFGSLGDIERKKGNENRAIELWQKAFFLSDSLHSAQRELEASLALYELFKRTGDYQVAMDKYENYIQIRDSLKNDENNKVIIRQETKYEFEKAELIKEQEAKEAQRLIDEQMSRRNNLQYSIILISLLLIFGGVLSLGFIKVSPKIAEGLIFFSFLILFEFALVLADPFVDKYSGGAPGYKLLFNALLAAVIFPAHAFFESMLKKKLVNNLRRTDD